MENVVIAGGAVLSCFLGGREVVGDDNKSDVDVLLVTDTPEQTRAVFDRIVEHSSRCEGDVEEAIGHHELLVTRLPFAVTSCVGPQRHLQLVLI